MILNQQIDTLAEVVKLGVIQRRDIMVGLHKALVSRKGRDGKVVKQEQAPLIRCLVLWMIF